MMLDSITPTALALLLGSLLFSVALAGDSNLSSRESGAEPTIELSNLKKQKRACTLDELLPQPSRKRASEWSHQHVDEPPHGCRCATMKGRYFCPNLGSEGYPRWVPKAATKGACRDVSPSDMEGGPLPPNFKVLIVGNSHLRQVTEGIMCNLEDDLSSKRVTLGVSNSHNSVDEVVSADMQCRGCSPQAMLEHMSETKRELLKHGCMDESDVCRCEDDRSEFYFENGAVVNYVFSDVGTKKHIENALHLHDDEWFTSYDMVIANNGNQPYMEPTAVIETALRLQGAQVPFFWLSTYSGKGAISDWSEKERAMFAHSGANFVPVGDMMRGMDRLKRGRVERKLHKNDPHFCMPGPPNELGILLVKMMWALHAEGVGA